MPRYQFNRDARPALMDQLAAAGLPTAVAEFDAIYSRAGGWLPGTTCWVTCDPADFDKVAAVVAAHDAAAIDAAAAQAATDDTTDRTTARQAITALLADAARLNDGTQALTAQQIRNHIARTDLALVAVLKYLARRGL